MDGLFAHSTITRAIFAHIARDSATNLAPVRLVCRAWACAIPAMPKFCAYVGARPGTMNPAASGDIQVMIEMFDETSIERWISQLLARYDEQSAQIRAKFSVFGVEPAPFARVFDAIARHPRFFNTSVLNLDDLNVDFTHAILRAHGDELIRELSVGPLSRDEIEAIFARIIGTRAIYGSTCETMIVLASHIMNQPRLITAISSRFSRYVGDQTLINMTRNVVHGEVPCGNSLVRQMRAGAIDEICKYNALFRDHLNGLAYSYGIEWVVPIQSAISLIIRARPGDLDLVAHINANRQSILSDGLREFMLMHGDISDKTCTNLLADLALYHVERREECVQIVEALRELCKESGSCRHHLCMKIIVTRGEIPSHKAMILAMIAEVEKSRASPCR